MSDIIQQENLNLILDLQEFAEHKKMAIKTNLYSRYKSINIKKALRTQECGQFLTFERYLNLDSLEIKNTLKTANFCKNRFCPFCAFLKSKKLVGEFKSIFSQIEQNSKAKISYLFLTLTIKNCELKDLKETLKRMSKAFNRMFDKEKLLNKHILGYVRAVEFVGDSTLAHEAHPHFHTILVVDSSYFQGKNYIKHSKWADMWRKYLQIPKNEPCIVDIRRIKAKNKDWTDADSALYETIKYCVSPPYLLGLPQEAFIELDKQVKGIRQYNRGGLCKFYKPLESEDLDLTIWKFLCEIFVSWRESNYQIGDITPSELAAYQQRRNHYKRLAYRSAE